MKTDPKPLHGIRVIELASVLAGPSVGFFLAELGAEVLKIESLKNGGDITRNWKTSKEDPNAEFSDYYWSVNRFKSHLKLNLKNAKDFSSLKTYIKSADIVLSNLSPKQEQQLKLSYKHIKALKPHCIFVSVRGFLNTPERPAFDALIQAESGWMWLNRKSDKHPQKLPIALIDIMCGHHLKQAVLLALLHRYKYKRGCEIRASLLDSAISSLNHSAYSILQHRGAEPINTNQHASIAPYGGCYLSKDLKWFIPAIGNDFQFIQLCKLLKCVSLTKQARFKTNIMRVKHRKSLDKIIKARFLKFKAPYITQKALELYVPIGQVYTVQEALQNHQPSLAIGYESVNKISYITSLPFSIRYE